jgi:hypothetical protein
MVLPEDQAANLPTGRAGYPSGWGTHEWVMMTNGYPVGGLKRCNYPPMGTHLAAYRGCTRTRKEVRKCLIAILNFMALSLLSLSTVYSIIHITTRACTHFLYISFLVYSQLAIFGIHSLYLFCLWIVTFLSSCSLCSCFRLCPLIGSFFPSFLLSSSFTFIPSYLSFIPCSPQHQACSN